MRSDVASPAQLVWKMIAKCIENGTNCTQERFCRKEHYLGIGIVRILSDASGPSRNKLPRVSTQRCRARSRTQHSCNERQFEHVSGDDF